MPIYVYEAILENADDDDIAQIFELMQPITAEPYTHHPDTGVPIRRIVTAPNLPQKWSDSKMKSSMSDSAIEGTGLTKYVKTSDGTYERTAGKEGPKHIDPKTLG